VTEVGFTPSVYHLLPGVQWDPEVVNGASFQCTSWDDFGLGKLSPNITLKLYQFKTRPVITFNGRQLFGTIINRGTSDEEVTFGPLFTADYPKAEGALSLEIDMMGTALRNPCHLTYQLTLECSKQGGGCIVGDPQFVGLRGQSYQVHGVAGEVYNIVSDSDVQYNSRFVFLTAGDCPVVEGKKLPGCFSHPGSYLGELGLKTRTGDKIRIVAGPAAEGFAAVELNGRMLEIGEIVELSDGVGSISRQNTHQITVSIGVWTFEFENSDMFINQRVKVSDARQLRSHGLLGQTWRQRTYPNPIKYIQGAVDDYVIRDGDIFGDSFIYNAFN